MVEARQYLDRPSEELQPLSINTIPSRGTALLVDQDQQHLQHCSRVLRRLGFQVQAYTRCQEGLQRLAQGPVEFVFVSQGGRAFEWQRIVERALLRSRYTPVIVITQALDIGGCREAIQLGATGYVQKPLRTAAIERLVDLYSQAGCSPPDTRTRDPEPRS